VTCGVGGADGSTPLATSRLTLSSRSATPRVTSSWPGDNKELNQPGKVTPRHTKQRARGWLQASPCPLFPQFAGSVRPIDLSESFAYSASRDKLPLEVQGMADGMASGSLDTREDSPPPTL